MSNNVSVYLQAARINFLRGTAYPTAPANTYVALFTVAPTNAGTGGTEVSGGAYARQAVASSGWAAASGASPTQTSNNGTITYPTATASWGTATAFALYDAVTGGNMLYTAALASNQTVNSGSTLSFQVGALIIQED